MAVVEKSGLMKYKDEAGNLYLMYPITTTDNVDGLDEALAAHIKTHNESQEAHPYIRGLIPTKTSQLYNDSGYLNKHQDISGKLDKPANSTTAMAGQVLTKTADGQEWKDCEKDIFWATYGTTSFNDIKAAYDAKKEIFVVRSGVVFKLSSFIGYSIFTFVGITATAPAGDEVYGEGHLSMFTLSISSKWSEIHTFTTDLALHASSHATGGSDPITPASIGAATMTEVNTAIQSAIGDAIGGGY